MYTFQIKNPNVVIYPKCTFFGLQLNRLAIFQYLHNLSKAHAWAWYFFWYGKFKKKFCCYIIFSIGTFFSIWHTKGGSKICWGHPGRAFWEPREIYAKQSWITVIRYIVSNSAHFTIILFDHFYKIKLRPRIVFQNVINPSSLCQSRRNGKM